MPTRTDEPIRLGDRLFLPVLMGPYARKPEDPIHRPLWVYVLDPARIGVKEPAQRIDVPYEPLGAEGIRGAVFEVDHDPLPDFLLEHLSWPDRLIRDFAENPLHLDDPRCAILGGIEPCTGKPLFAGQMAYAVCQRVYATFAEALGRYPTWAPWAARRIRNHQRPTLKIRPFAFARPNACYDSETGALEFGVFKAGETDSPNVLPGGLVLTTMSHDIIAHEVTHALLDGMRAHFRVNTHPDVAAFHEGFADLVALLHHFRYPSLVEQAIEEHGGLNAKMLLELGREFGEALYGVEGRCLRKAVEYVPMPGESVPGRLLCYDHAPVNQPHARGSILVAAIFSAFLQVYERRAKALLKLANYTSRGRADRVLPGPLVNLLAEEAATVADEFLHLCIRAVDYCPPLDVRFGDYLRAIVTADRVLNPEDRYGMRETLIREFRRRRIDLGRVRDLSEYSLEWNSPSPVERPVIPELAWSELRFQNDGRTPRSISDVESQAGSLGTFLLGVLARGDMKGEFGVTQVGGKYGPITIESLRSVVRRGRDGRLMHGVVAEISQTRETAEGMVWGGSTLVITETGAIEFAVRKRVDDDQRLLEQHLHLADTGGDRELSFRQLHGHE